MLKTIIHKLCQIRNKLISRDDFAWNRYHKNYYNQIKNSEKDYTLKLSNNFKITNEKLEFSCNPPLNKNAEILYQVIYDLNPNSIFEVGCGGGDHMFNLLKIMSLTNIKGCDLLQKQLDFLNKRSPELKDKTIVHDITLNPLFPPKKLVYTQAVIMHIQKGNRHIDALRNLINSSDKYIVLMENWARHNFVKDIQNISLGLEDDLYIYKVDNGKQIIMILSKVPIKNKKLDYIKVESDEELLKYLK